MIWFEAAAAAAMGAAALSFVQVAVDRAGSGQTGLLERSRCPRCQAQLRALDVLPIAGFLMLHGRCRGCRATIPRRHLVGELVAAVLWAAAVLLLGATVWLPLVLVAPLAALLLHSPMVRAGSARDLAAAAFPPVGMALLTFGLVGLLQGRCSAYAAGGLLGAVALGAGGLAASRDRV